MLLLERGAPRHTGGKLRTECLETAAATLICVLKEMKTRVHSVQDLLSSCVLFKNTNIKIHRTLMLPPFCMGVKRGLSQCGRNYAESVRE
jgi:hypothetical protein